MKNIVLIGMPGCGKTTIGKLLSKTLQLEFINMDDYIENYAGESITDMFSKGEEYFRNIETECSRNLGELYNHVISTGGGIIKRKKNIDYLKNNSIIIFINRPVGNILEDIDTIGRPLLKDGKEKLYDLYNERINLYKMYCDIEIINNSNIEYVIGTIVQKTINSR